MSFAAMAPWLVPSAISALGLFFGGGGGGAEVPPEIRAAIDQALRLQNNRMLYQNPLFEEATTLASALLPKSARPSQYRLGGIDAMTPGEPGLRTPSPDAQYIGRAVRRGVTPRKESTTADAVQYLAGGVRSPLEAYREQMLRGRASGR